VLFRSFKRTWIKQEVWASASIEVLYRGLKITWSALKAWTELYHSTLERVVPPADRPKITDLAKQLKRLLSPLDQGSSEEHHRARERDIPNPFLDPEDILDFIRVHNKADVRRAGCSDQRDRICALLTMSTLGAAQISQPSNTSFRINCAEHPASNIRTVGQVHHTSR
jgi:hypothetical protein